MPLPKSVADWDPGKLSGSDKMMLFGAMLKDAVRSYNGEDGNDLANTQSLLAQRQALARKQLFQQKLGSLLAGQAPQYSPGTIDLTPAQAQGPNAPQFDAGPTRTVGGGLVETAPAQSPLTMNDPRMAAIVMGAQDAGYNMDDLLKVMTAQQPHVVVGPDGQTFNDKDPGALNRRFRNPTAVGQTIIDLNNPDNEGYVVPEAPVKGAMPTYDNRGRVIDWTLPAGARGAIGEAAQAQQTGQTFGTVYNRPNGDGSTTPTLGRDMFGGGGSGGTGGGGAGRTQTPGDAEYQKGVALADQKRYEGFLSAGQSARGVEGNLRRMQGLLEGVNTGRLTPTGKELASVATSFGIKVNPKWGNVEAADAIANKLVLEVMGGSLGAGFSNADRDFARSMGPQTAQTPQGRAQIISFALAKAQRDQQIGQMARQWQQRAGRLDRADRSGKTFYDYLDAYAESHPLVPRR